MVRGEHQRGRAALVRAVAGRGLVRARLATCSDGKQLGRRRHGAETSEEKMRTWKNEGSTSIMSSCTVDLSCWEVETMTGGESLIAKWISASLMAGGRKSIDSRRSGGRGWD